MRDYSPYFSVLQSYARKLMRKREDADDLFQETVLKLLQNDHRFDGQNTVAWAATIMRNHLYSQTRSLYHKRREPLPPDFELRAVPQHDPAEYAETMRALHALPPKYRDLLIAKAEGYSVEELAHMFQINIGTIKSRTTRARMALLKALGETPFNPQILDKAT